MSRTIRKDHSAFRWGRSNQEFSSLHPDPWAIDFFCERTEEGKPCWVYFVVTNKRDLWARKRNVFGESRHANHRSPGKVYRKEDIRAIRNIGRREIFKYMKDETYEPSVPKKDAKEVWWSWS